MAGFIRRRVTSFRRSRRSNWVCPYCLLDLQGSSCCCGKGKHELLRLAGFVLPQCLWRRSWVRPFGRSAVFCLSFRLCVSRPRSHFLILSIGRVEESMHG